MSLEDFFFSRVQISPTLPEIVTRVQASIVYTPKALEDEWPEDRYDSWVDTMEDLTRLLNYGFLARPASSQAVTTCSATMSAPNTLVLGIETQGGAHINLVILLLRLIYSTHQTPPDAFAKLVAAFDGDEEAAKEVYGGINLNDHVDAVRLDVAGQEGAESLQFDLRYAYQPNCFLPASGPVSEQSVVEFDLLRFSGMSVTTLDEDYEDAFLLISSLDSFLPIGFSAASEPGEEEIVIRADGTATIEDISIEQVFLFEALACANGGTLAGVTLTEHEP